MDWPLWRREVYNDQARYDKRSHIAGKEATMRSRLLSIITISLVLGILGGAAHAQTSQPSGATVSGRVTVPAGAIPEMIVYLESTDGSKFPAPPEVSISQKGAKFTPALLIISAGQTVNFKNDETGKSIEHNVFSRSPTQSFDLGLYLPPTDKRVAFNTPGVVRLYCSIHRLMDGVIYICPTPFWAQVDANGSFNITNVPAGNWKIRTWQRNAKFNEAEAPVKTEGAGRANVDLKLSRD